MFIKLFLSTAVLISVNISVIAQQKVTKVVRKGEKPVIITKPSANDKSTFTINQFTGRWQEISRRDRQTNAPVNFTDTLFYHFTGTNDVFTRDGVTMSMRGKASIEPGNELVAAADVFTIRSVNRQEAVLDDRDKYIHTLIKKKSFWYETLPSNSVTPEKFTTPINAKSSDLIGNWMVYRRDAAPGAIASDEYLVKVMNITRAVGDNAYGNLTFFHSDRTDSMSCTITLSGQKLNIVTDKHSWQLSVYKANGSELVFGNPTLMYYCKLW